MRVSVEIRSHPASIEVDAVAGTWQDTETMNASRRDIDSRTPSVLVQPSRSCSPL